MPHEVSWYVEERVVYVQVSGILSMKDICHLNRDVCALLETGTPPVHIIMHHLGLEKAPSNLRQMRRALTILDHEALGLVVDVAERTGVWSYVGQMLVRMSRLSFRHVNTLEEARQLLADYDPSLVEALESITT